MKNGTNEKKWTSEAYENIKKVLVAQFHFFSSVSDITLVKKIISLENNSETLKHALCIAKSSNLTNFYVR